MFFLNTLTGVKACAKLKKEGFVPNEQLFHSLTLDSHPSIARREDKIYCRNTRRAASAIRSLLLLLHSGHSTGSLLCSNFIFTSAQGPVTEGKASGRAGVSGGPQKLDVLLSLEKTGASDHPSLSERLWNSSPAPPTSAHSEKHLSRRHIAAKRSLYSLSTGLRCADGGNRQPDFLSPPFQASAGAHAIGLRDVQRRKKKYWSVCCGEKPCLRRRGEHAAVTFPVDWE